jgi:hypothetical protein
MSHPAAAAATAAAAGVACEVVVVYTLGCCLPDCSDPLLQQSLADDKAGPAAWLQLVRQLHSAAAAAAGGSSSAAAAAAGVGQLLHVVPGGRGLVLYHANDYWVLVGALAWTVKDFGLCWPAVQYICAACEIVKGLIVAFL